ncbi:fungal-specific transcription factor domain-containing protein [Pyronema domesticum]|nr:fungal-specific transcription factor domain-containing protein [Pyronema domesticum]
MLETIDQMSSPQQTNATTPVAVPQRLRTSKACEECRKRKIKCNGQSSITCDYCATKGLVCVYRSQARTRRRPNILMRTPAVPHSSCSGSGGDSTAADGLGDAAKSPLEGSVYAGVSATYAVDSPSRTLQLYYGPSSNFPMIQHINERLPKPDESDDESSREASSIEPLDKGLDRFQYGPIYFSKYSDQQEFSYPGGVDGVGVNESRANQASLESSLMFLTYEQASEFLGKFLQTLQKHMPFIQPDAAQDMLNAMFGKHPDVNSQYRDLDIGERGIMLAILAIGATLTDHSMTWGETLYQKARKLSDELDDVVNVHVCQLGLLLGHYNSICGKPNSVYLLVGAAMRKALAAGLHKEALTKGRRQESIDHYLAQERRFTFWSIYIFEVTISFGLGRPISVNDADITIPYPDGCPFFLTLVQLSRIYTKASKQLYSTKEGSLHALYQTALGLKAELDIFRSSLPCELSIGPDAIEAAKDSSEDVHRLFLNNWYYHLLILIFRPFLIFHAQWQRDHRVAVAETKEQISVSTRQLRERTPWLFTACDMCVSAAREGLLCLSKAVEKNDLVRRLAYNCFYIEGGAFLCIFNMLRDKEGRDEDRKAVMMAISAMEQMGGGRPGVISRRAIGRMLELVEAQKEQGNKEETTSPESMADPRGSVGAFELPSRSLDGMVAGTSSNSFTHGTNGANGDGMMMPGAQRDATQDPFLAPMVTEGLMDTTGFRDPQNQQPMDFNVGDLSFNFDIGNMDVDCWLEMNPYQDGSESLG